MYCEHVKEERCNQMMHFAHHLSGEWFSFSLLISRREIMKATDFERHLLFNKKCSFFVLVTRKRKCFAVLISLRRQQQQFMCSEAIHQHEETLFKPTIFHSSSSSSGGSLAAQQ